MCHPRSVSRVNLVTNGKGAVPSRGAPGFGERYPSKSQTHPPGLGRESSSLFRSDRGSACIVFPRTKAAPGKPEEEIPRIVGWEDSAQERDSVPVCDRIRKSAECSVVVHVWPKFAGHSGVPLVSLRLVTHEPQCLGFPVG